MTPSWKYERLYLAFQLDLHRGDVDAVMMSLKMAELRDQRAEEERQEEEDRRRWVSRRDWLQEMEDRRRWARTNYWPSAQEAFEDAERHRVRFEEEAQRRRNSHQVWESMQNERFNPQRARRIEARAEQRRVRYGRYPLHDEEKWKWGLSGKRPFEDTWLWGPRPARLKMKSNGRRRARKRPSLALAAH